MDKDLMYDTLLAIRAQVDFLTKLLESEQRKENEICQHPPQARVSMSTFGKTQWQCNICGYMHTDKEIDHG